MPPELGFGGFDLTDGAEQKSIQWINTVTQAVPPPILFSRRCIDVDIHPDFLNKRAKQCCPVSRFSSTCGDPNHAFSSGKPDGMVECNWACNKGRSCSTACSRRSQQRGVAHSFQVFMHEYKGWCLRTLTSICKGEYIMEYVGERLSKERDSERTTMNPDAEIYMMDIEHRGRLSLDALEVRNHAAFAAFACRRTFANMEKRSFHTFHWDDVSCFSSANNRAPLHVSIFVVTRCPCTAENPARWLLCYTRHSTWRGAHVPTQ